MNCVLFKLPDIENIKSMRRPVEKKDIKTTNEKILKHIFRLKCNTNDICNIEKTKIYFGEVTGAHNITVDGFYKIIYFQPL